MIQLHVGVARVQDTDKFVEQRLGFDVRGASLNDATHIVTTFSVPRLGVFLSCLQHSVPGISHNVSYLIQLKKKLFQNVDELLASSIKLQDTISYSRMITKQKLQK